MSGDIYLEGACDAKKIAIKHETCIEKLTPVALMDLARSIDWNQTFARETHLNSKIKLVDSIVAHKSKGSTWEEVTENNTKAIQPLKAQFEKSPWAHVAPPVEYIPPTKRVLVEGFIHAGRRDFYTTDLTGKWCILRDINTVDATWERIRLAVEAGSLVAAIVSSPNQARTHNGSYVICVFTKQWEDKEDVMRTREVLHRLGIDEELGYKRDIETLNGVYNAPEEWYYRA